MDICATSPDRPCSAKIMVLVVDDEPLVRRLVATVLSTFGYHVVDVETPEHAIRVFDSQPSLELLVTDVLMPEIGGCELAERLRQKQPGLKVLFMSGYSPLEVETTAENSTRFLQKPFLPTDLMDCVRQLLR